MEPEQIKSALLNHEFDSAKALIEEWGQRIKLEMQLAGDPSQAKRIFDDATSFAQENTNLARVVRAHLAAQLAFNSASFLYRDAELERHDWQISG